MFRPPALAGMIIAGRSKVRRIGMPIRQWLKVGPQLCTEGINGREEIWGGKREGVLGDTNTLPAMHLKADQGCHSGSWLCLNGVTDAQARVTVI
jgi:hypothetical protein